MLLQKIPASPSPFSAASNQAQWRGLAWLPNCKGVLMFILFPHFIGFIANSLGCIVHLNNLRGRLQNGGIGLLQ